MLITGNLSLAASSTSSRFNVFTEKLDEGTDDELIVTGYQRVPWRLALVWTAVTATAGLLGLIFYWVPRWQLKLTHRVVPLGKADTVLIEVSKLFLTSKNVLNQI
jgi:hypothetical protein